MTTMLDVLKRGAKAVIRLTPYDVRRRDRATRRQSWEAEFQTALDAVAHVRRYSMVDGRALVTLYRQVAHCEDHGIPGALVECGVWKGGAAALMRARRAGERA